MAQDNDIHTDTPVLLLAEVPAGLASILLQKPQFLFSERMYDILQMVLTDEQKDVLAHASVDARPVVFQGAVLVQR
jgi:hypothetical protein